MIDHDHRSNGPELFDPNAAYALAATAELRTSLHAGETRYSEVHLVDNTPYLVVAPRPLFTDRPEPTITGYHSITDTIRNYEASMYPDFMRYIDDPAHTLASTTVWAKGETALTDEQQLQLRLHPHARKAYSMSQLLNFMFDNAGAWGIDELAMLSHDGDAISPIAIDAEKLHYAYLEPHKIDKEELGPKGNYNAEVICGVARDIELEPVSWSSNEGNNSIEPRSSMKVVTNEANTVYHKPIQDYLERANAHGFIPVRWEGTKEHIYMTYVLDARRQGIGQYLTVLFYHEDGPSGPINLPQARLVATLARALSHYYEFDQGNLLIETKVTQPKWLKLQQPKTHLA
jgi:hypothetical protein